MNVCDLHSYFDCVVVINLQRREDRWKRFLRNLPMDWPFSYPLRFFGVDGAAVGAPTWWTQGDGAWGCYLSHLAILEDCLKRNVQRVLILEDDAIARPNMAIDVRHFITHLPEDWRIIHLGGQLLELDQRAPSKLNEWVYKPYNVNRTHAYALNTGATIRALYEFLQNPQSWQPNQHIDHRMGDYMKQVPDGNYVPRKWLIGQMDGESDVCGRTVGFRIFVSPEDAGKPKGGIV